MFVTKPRLFLAYVFENRFAVPSFNVSNLEMARAVIEAAELENAPVMVQTDFINFDYGGIEELSAIIRTLAEKTAAPVLMHQDHPGKDENIFRTLRRGYYSVMYDGGHLPLAENIAGTAGLPKPLTRPAQFWRPRSANSAVSTRVGVPSRQRRKKPLKWSRKAELTLWRFRRIDAWPKEPARP